MRLSVREQKEYLAEKLIVEPLTSDCRNKELIKSFVQPNNSNVLSEYLINDAWDEDCQGKTKVFLVKDKKTGEIVFYYAINSGLLFRELSPSIQLLDSERGPFKRYVDILIKQKNPNNSHKEAEELNAQMGKAMQDIFDATNDVDRASFLFMAANETAIEKDEKNKDVPEDERNISQNVKETFSAIDIKYFCRNKNYKCDIELDFRLGVFVFWELIVPHVLKISNLMGCEYLYLFAADNTVGRDFSKEGCIIEEGPDSADKKVEKLVNYYKNELRFRNVVRYRVLKPEFERTCFTLIQDVSDLKIRREEVWASHED